MDVDLLKSLYESSTMTVMVGDTTSANIFMDTGTGQGSILSPLIFDLFINALLRLITSSGISHGVANVPGFNHLAFVDDLSLFVSSEEDANRLLLLVKQFEAVSYTHLTLPTKA